LTYSLRSHSGWKSGSFSSEISTYSAYAATQKPTNAYALMILFTVLSWTMFRQPRRSFVYIRRDSGAVPTLTVVPIIVFGHTWNWFYANILYSARYLHCIAPIIIRFVCRDDRHAWWLGGGYRPILFSSSQDDDDDSVYFFNFSKFQKLNFIKIRQRLYIL